MWIIWRSRSFRSERMWNDSPTSNAKHNTVFNVISFLHIRIYHIIRRYNRETRIWLHISFFICLFSCFTHTSEFCIRTWNAQKCNEIYTFVKLAHLSISIFVKSMPLFCKLFASICKSIFRICKSKLSPWNQKFKSWANFT